MTLNPYLVTLSKNEPVNKIKGAQYCEQTAAFSQGIAKSSSFSKFKNAFEDGVGIMDTENVDNDKFRVNAETQYF